MLNFKIKNEIFDIDEEEEKKIMFLFEKQSHFLSLTVLLMIVIKLIFLKVF